MKPIHYSQLTPELAHAGCFVLDMPNEAYHSYEGISNSGLNLVSRSPAHYAHAAARTATRAMDIGTAFHTALLEPERYAAEYMTVSGINDRRKSEYVQAAKQYGKDKTLTESEGASVAVMQEAIRANSAARAILDQKGYAELSAFIADPGTGVLMRCRFDWLTESGIALDLKKTQDSRESAFSRSIWQYRYHCQHAMYSHVYELITGQPLQAFKFLAVEEQPPCANVVYQLDDVAAKYGHQQYREALTAYAEAEQSGHWAAYGVESDLISLPEYALIMLESEGDEYE